MSNNLEVSMKKWVLNINLHGVGLFKTNLDEKMAYKLEQNWKIFFFGSKTIFHDILISRLSWESIFHGILISRISNLNRQTVKTSCFKVEPLKGSINHVQKI